MIRSLYDDYNATESEMQTETETEINGTSSIGTSYITIAIQLIKLILLHPGF